MKKNFIKISLFVVLILGFIYSAIQLFQIYYRYHTSFRIYDTIKNAVEVTINGDSTAFLPDIEIDFKQLKKMNPDAIAWIIIPDTPVNYPVVQTTNNTFYLDHAINKVKDIAGCIFLDSKNSSDFTDLHTLLYGHNLKNGMMFATLNDYAEKSYWEKNPYFWILTPDKTYCYQIFSTYLVDPELSKSYQIKFQNITDFEDFIHSIKQSNYKTNISIRATDKIVSLSTCTNQDRLRRVIHGKLFNI